MGGFWKDKAAFIEHNRRIASLGGKTRSAKRRAASRVSLAKARAVMLDRMEAAGLPRDPTLLWLGQGKLSQLAEAYREAQRPRIDWEAPSHAQCLSSDPGYDFGLV